MAERLSSQHLTLKAKDWKAAFDSLATQLRLPIVAPIPRTSCQLKLQGEAPVVLERLASCIEGRWQTYQGCLFLQPEITAGIVSTNGSPADMSTLEGEFADRKILWPRYAFFFSLTREQLEQFSKGTPLSVGSLTQQQREYLLRMVRQKEEFAGMCDADLLKENVLPVLRVEARVFWRGQIVLGSRLIATEGSGFEEIFNGKLFGGDDAATIHGELPTPLQRVRTATLEGGEYGLARTEGVPSVLESIGLKVSVDKDLASLRFYISAGRWNVPSLLTVLQLLSYCRFRLAPEGLSLHLTDTASQVRIEARRAELVWRSFCPIVQSLATSPSNELGPTSPAEILSPVLVPWPGLPERLRDLVVRSTGTGCEPVLFKEHPMDVEYAVLPVLTVKLQRDQNDKNPIKVEAALPGGYSWLYLRTRLSEVEL